MTRLLSALTATMCGLVLMTSARGADFTINLKLTAGKTTATAYGSKQKPLKDVQTRPVLHVTAGQRVQTLWQIQCAASKQPLTDVIVHFVVVREAKVGQSTMPKLGKQVSVESALTTDFKTGDNASGELSIVLDRPGAYLVRLETIGAASAGGTETFAALDVIVK